MRERQTEPTDQEMKKLMGMKRIARGAMGVMILCLVLVFVALLLKNAGVDIADTAGVVLTVLLFAMALIYYHFHEKAKRQQAAMGVDRTPDEVAKEREKERKRVEEVNRLVSTPGAVDRRLARLAGLYRFCQWNINVGLVGILLALVVILVHTFVIEISMSYLAVFAIALSLVLVIGMVGTFLVQKQQKKLSLHYTPEVLEAVLDRVELYDHKGSVDHGYAEPAADGSGGRVHRSGAGGHARRLAGFGDRHCGPVQRPEGNAKLSGRGGDPAGALPGV